MSTRRRRKYIYSMKRQDGTLTWAHQEKEEIIHDFFSKLMGTKEARSRTFDLDKLSMSRLQELSGLELDRPFSEGEIEYTVKCLPNGKAPGPDGFTNDFYKSCWDIIKFDVLSAFHSIHSLHCDYLTQINGAQVILIPKVEVAAELKDFRPISLIHSFAKLFMKVLALRLSGYIGKLISKSQSAFIKGRYIQDNFLYVRDLARHYHRSKTPVCLFKLDISKAFDTVSWEYLLEMLSQRGFSRRWTDWLAALLRTSSSVIMLNSNSGPRICHSRGLRQGDPLSPYLFILAMDVLSRIFEIATEEGLLTPLKGRHARLRLSLYADDVMIFCNPIKSDITGIMQIMKAFGDTTGLQINMAKSSVALIRCAVIDMMTCSLTLQVGESPFRTNTWGCRSHLGG
jgi:mannosylglycoprotein endo-beta-mannosidase